MEKRKRAKAERQRDKERQNKVKVKEEKERERERIRYISVVQQRPRNYNGRVGRSFDNDFLNAGLRR